MKVVSKDYTKQILTDETLTRDQLFNHYKKDGVLIERLELYYNFCFNFFNTLHNSYLGKEFIKTDADKNSYFNWVFSKTCDQFKSIGFDFSNNADVKKYLNEHTKEQIYNNSDYNEEYLEMDLLYVETILKFDSHKTKKDLILTYDLYFKFDYSL